MSLSFNLALCQIVNLVSQHTCTLIDNDNVLLFPVLLFCLVLCLSERASVRACVCACACACARAFFAVCDFSYLYFFSLQSMYSIILPYLSIIL